MCCVLKNLNESRRFVEAASAPLNSDSMKDDELDREMAEMLSDQTIPAPHSSPTSDQGISGTSPLCL